MKALVTGGAGFIGSNLVEALVDDYEVTVLDNLHTGSMDNLKSVQKDVKFVKGSCNNCLDLGLEQHEIIFHLGIPSSSPMYKKDPFLVGEAINGMVAIMELARKSETKKVVFASSSSVYNGVPTPHREDAVIPVKDYYTEARLAIARVAEQILHFTRRPSPRCRGRWIIPSPPIRPMWMARSMCWPGTAEQRNSSSHPHQRSTAMSRRCPSEKT